MRKLASVVIGVDRRSDHQCWIYQQMAVYTALNKKEVAKIADEFALGDLVSFAGVKNGSVNTHYLIETKRGKYFAKLEEVKGELELKQELDLLLHLRKQNFPCLQPLKTKSGRFTTE